MGCGGVYGDGRVTEFG